MTEPSIPGHWYLGVASFIAAHNAVIGDKDAKIARLSAELEVMTRDRDACKALFGPSERAAQIATDRNVMLSAELVEAKRQWSNYESAASDWFARGNALMAALERTIPGLEDRAARVRADWETTDEQEADAEEDVATARAAIANIHATKGRGRPTYNITIRAEPREGGYYFISSPELKGFTLLLEPGNYDDLKTFIDAIYEPLTKYLTILNRARSNAQAKNVRMRSLKMSDGTQMVELSTQLEAAREAATRADRIAKMTQRGRRFASEQWARAAQEALDGKPQNLRNRVELQRVSIAAVGRDQTDGSPLIELDENNLAFIDEGLEAAREALEPFAKIADTIPDGLSDNWILEGAWAEGVFSTVTNGDFRRARAALGKLAATKGAPQDETPRWPHGCPHPNSCARHGQCGYLGCRYEGMDIKADILAATKGE